MQLLKIDSLKVASKFENVHAISEGCKQLLKDALNIEKIQHQNPKLGVFYL